MGLSEEVRIQKALFRALNNEKATVLQAQSSLDDFLSQFIEITHSHIAKNNPLALAQFRKDIGLVAKRFQDGTYFGTSLSRTDTVALAQEGKASMYFLSSVLTRQYVREQEGFSQPELFYHLAKKHKEISWYTCPQKQISEIEYGRGHTGLVFIPYLQWFDEVAPSHIELVDA